MSALFQERALFIVLLVNDIVNNFYMQTFAMAATNDNGF